MFFSKKIWFPCLCLATSFLLAQTRPKNNTPLSSNHPSQAFLEESDALKESFKHLASKRDHTQITSVWREIGPTSTPGGPGPDRLKGTGRLVFIEFDEVYGRIFTGSPLGGLWYSEDEGESWLNGGTDYLPEIGVSHMQVAPKVNQGETWFIATGDGEGAFNPSNGIWRTTDKGRFWYKLNGKNSLGIGNKFPPFFWSRCRKILVHPEDGNTLYAAFAHGLYKTKNALAVNPDDVLWEKVADGSVTDGFFDVCFQPGSNGRVVVASGKKVAVSNQSGEKGSFQLIPQLENIQKIREERVSLRFAPSNPNILYGASKGWLFRYNLKTREVENNKVGSRYQRHQAIGISQKDENEVWIGNITPIFQSQDGGKTFTAKPEKERPYHDDQHWISCRENGEVWIANDGGIYRSKDQGLSWQSLTNGIGVAVYYNIGTSERIPELIIGGGWDTGPNLRSDSSNTFEVMNAFGDAFESVVNDSDPENPIYYVSIQGGVKRIESDLKKVSFSNKPSYQIKGGRNWVHSFVKNHKNQETLFYAGDKYVGRTKDGGFKWESISPNAKAENRKRLYSSVWTSKNNSNYLYAQRISRDAQDEMGFQILKCVEANKDSNLVWEDIGTTLYAEFERDGFQINEISDLIVKEEDPDQVWVSIPSYKDDQFKVWRYNGESWKPLSNNGLEGHRVSSLAYQQNTNDLIYAGTNAGVFYWDNTANRWRLMLGVPHANVSELEVNDCALLLRAATFGRGIWEAGLSDRFEECVIEKDQVWNEPRFTNATTVIEPGVRLEITTDVNMGQGAKIYIQKGGELIVKGKLYNDCGRKWKGIWVEGQINPIKSFESVPEIKIVGRGEVLDF